MTFRFTCCERNIGHSMSISNPILGTSSVTVSYLICYDSLLQNASAILLQNATEVYYKMRQVFCYKFTKCDSYYNMRRLLQIATVQTTFYPKCPLLLQIVNVKILRSLSSLCVRVRIRG